MNLLQIPDFIWAKLWENFPYIVVLIFIIAVTVYIVKTLDKFLYKKIDPLKEKVDNLNIKADKLEEFIQQLDERSDCISHKESMKKVYNMLSNISLTLAAKFPESLEKLSIAHSPRQLTESGKKLLEESGGKKMIYENMDFLFSLIDKEDIKTALDVENKSFNILLTSSNEAIFNDVKKWIYINPVFEDINVTLNDICYVMSLELRNEYLRLHPEIEQDL